MKNKRILVICVILILLSLVTTVAFAIDGNLNGVMWVVVTGQSARLGRNQTRPQYTEIYNSNNYAVTVEIRQDSGKSLARFSANETKHYNGAFSVVSVTKY